MIAVFAGPSLSRDDADLTPDDAAVLSWHPPARRGDLYDVCDDPALRTIVLLDGLFHETNAVSPREVRDVAEAGVRVVGAASMGALRAAECRPVPNVEGHGLIERLFRWGVVDADDEVAVVTDPDEGYRSVTVALVDVRIATRRAARRGLLTAGEAADVVRAAEDLPYPRRSWTTIARGADVSRERLAEVGAYSQKRADGLAAVRHALGTDRRSASARRPVDRATTVRYPGYDQYLGHAPGDARRVLLTWLFGSGRYVRHVWPLVATGSAPGTAGGPDAARDSALARLGELLRDEAATAQALWDELDYTGEAPRLLMWHAACVVARRTRVPDAGAMAHAGDLVGIRHGYEGLDSMLDDVHDDKLAGLVPWNWIQDAIDLEAARIAAERAA